METSGGGIKVSLREYANSSVESYHLYPSYCIKDNVVKISQNQTNKRCRVDNFHYYPY